MPGKRNVHGEGNYEATRKYNEATKKFIASGRVEDAAREAAPRTPREAGEMKLAEQAALLRAKGETKKTPPEIPGGKPQPIDDPGREPGPPDGPSETPPRPRQGPDRR